MTTDHKPDTPSEMSRIKKCGGKVNTSSGISRVVWSRPSLKHKGPGSISNLVDEIPFSALSRSIGNYDMFFIRNLPTMYVLSELFAENSSRRKCKKC